MKTPRLTSRLARYASALLVATAGLLLALPAAAEKIVGRVVGVADGDTVTVLDAQNRQHKVRLTGIDAPEKAQAFGQRSKESLSSLVFSQVVTVQTRKTDDYGRQLGQIWLGQLDVNLEQLRRGMAWHYKNYEREQPLLERLAYRNAEDEARSKRIGLWRDPLPVEPWLFRRETKDAGAAH